MERLRDAAMKDPYALNELRHLTDNIGPRLSGSPQAGQAVEYVAAEMRALGAEVTLEKAKVPHWVRGAETGRSGGLAGPDAGNHAEGRAHRAGRKRGHAGRGPHRRSRCRQTIGSSSARSLPARSKGKILLFNHKFDKELAAAGQWTGGLRRRRCVSRRWAHCRCCRGRRCRAGALGWRRGLPPAAHRDSPSIPTGCRRFPPPRSPPKTPICWRT